ncbi:MAG TPA: hypothetical protein VFA70_11450, partial [Dehalococcoidia bacterium]|nr:hypothetical protein [Dehalococcoidia bacterium]
GFVLGGLLLIAAGTWFALQPVPRPVSENASSLLSLIPAGTPAVLDTAGRFLRFAVAVVGLLLMLFIGLWRLTDWSTVPVRLVAAPPAAPPYPAAAYPSPGAPVTVPAAPPPQPASSPDALRWAPPEVRNTAVTSPSPPLQAAVETEPPSPAASAPFEAGNASPVADASDPAREGA